MVKSTWVPVIVKSVEADDAEQSSETNSQPLGGANSVTK
jgi:hypothetical protein